MALVSAYGRIALGNRVHVVGHSGGNLVHRSSQDNGTTWSTPSIVASAAGNYPMQYGGLSTVGDTVYLLTAAGDMGPSSQPLDFRKSTNNGATWSNPIHKMNFQASTHALRWFALGTGLLGIAVLAGCKGIPKQGERQARQQGQANGGILAR